jgi:hypothetical protein
MTLRLCKKWYTSESLAAKCPWCGLKAFYDGFYERRDIVICIMCNKIFRLADISLSEREAQKNE